MAIKPFNVTPAVAHKVAKKIFEEWGFTPEPVYKRGMTTITNVWLDDYWKFGFKLEKGVDTTLYIQCWMSNLEYWIVKDNKLHLGFSQSTIANKKSGAYKIVFGGASRKKHMQSIDDFEIFMRENLDNAYKEFKDNHIIVMNKCKPLILKDISAEAYTKLNSVDSSFIKSLDWTEEELSKLYNKTGDDDFMSEAAQEIFIF